VSAIRSEAPGPNRATARHALVGLVAPKGAPPTHKKTAPLNKPGRRFHRSAQGGDQTLAASSAALNVALGRITAEVLAASGM
jgi:hypothetical protein